MTEEKFQNLKVEKPAQTEKEYWRLHKMFSRHLTKLSLRIYKLPTKTNEYIDDYKELLSEGVRLNIISEEFKQQKINQFYKEMTSPSRFTQDMKEKMQKAKDKFFKKKQ